MLLTPGSHGVVCFVYFLFLIYHHILFHLLGKCYVTLLYISVLYDTVIYATILYITVLYVIVLYVTVHYIIVLYVNLYIMSMYYVSLYSHSSKYTTFRVCIMTFPPALQRAEEHILFLPTLPYLYHYVFV